MEKMCLIEDVTTMVVLNSVLSLEALAGSVRMVVD